MNSALKRITYAWRSASNRNALQIDVNRDKFEAVRNCWQVIRPGRKPADDVESVAAMTPRLELPDATVATGLSRHPSVSRNRYLSRRISSRWRKIRQGLDVAHDIDQD